MEQYFVLLLQISYGCFLAQIKVIKTFFYNDSYYKSISELASFEY